MTEAALREAGAVPETHWHLLGHAPEPVDTAHQDGHIERLGWVADPWPMLCRADVVVAAPGDAAIADVAASGRPLIAVPQNRPFGEQQAQAAALARHWLCLSVPTWPDRRAWPQLLDRAESLGGAGWSAYYNGRGSARMAATLLELSGRDRGSRPRRSAMHPGLVGASALRGARRDGPAARLAVG